MITINFGAFFEDDSPIWALCPDFSDVFPDGVEDLTEDMIQNIVMHYYYREIGFANPTRFLLEFQRTVRQRAHVWKMLIDSENALSADDMTYNYDMTENRNRSLNVNSENVRTPNLKHNSLVRSNNTNEQDLTETRNNKLHQMDTPDGITNDINNYLTYADKTEETTTQHGEGEATGQTVQNSTETGRDTTTGEQTHVETETVTRRGNIGVQTAGQILQYWRQAEAFSAYNDIIFPELDPLFLGTADIDEGYTW